RTCQGDDGQGQTQRRRHIANAKFERAKIGPRADVPVDVLKRRDRLAIAHHLAIGAKLLPFAKVRRHAGLRQKRIKSSPTRCESGVHAWPEGELADSARRCGRYLTIRLRTATAVSPLGTPT